jgi:hypothetical protein
MTCRKYEILYTDVLECGTRNVMEWSRVLYSYDCCRNMYVAGGMSTRSYKIRCIMTRRTLLRVTSSGVQFSCSSAFDCLELADAFFLSWAPNCKCVFKIWSHKYRIALGFDFCWATAGVSAREGECVVCLLVDCCAGVTTGDTYSSMAPDPTSDIFRDLCTPILWFVFPTGLMRLITVRYFCHFNVPVEGFYRCSNLDSSWSWRCSVPVLGWYTYTVV